MRVRRLRRVAVAGGAPMSGLSANDVHRIAREADVDQRTVKAYFALAPLRARTKVRIQDALKKLGIPEPEAKAGQ
jgi:hypothetical protein